MAEEGLFDHLTVLTKAELMLVGLRLNLTIVTTMKKDEMIRIIETIKLDHLTILTKSELMLIGLRLNLTMVTTMKEDEMIRIIKTVKSKPHKISKSIPGAVRDKVWNENIGVEFGIGKCYCCGGNITRANYECGHIVSRATGGDDSVANLKPVCGPCNKSMGIKNMHEFIKEYGMSQNTESEKHVKKHSKKHDPKIDTPPYHTIIEETQSKIQTKKSRFQSCSII